MEERIEWKKGRCQIEYGNGKEEVRARIRQKIRIKEISDESGAEEDDKSKKKVKLQKNNLIVKRRNMTINSGERYISKVNRNREGKEVWCECIN